MPVDIAEHAETGDALDGANRDQFHVRLVGGEPHRYADGMARADLERADQPQELGAVSVGLNDLRCHHSCRQRSRLVEQDHIDVPGPLEHLRSLEQDAQLSPLAASDHDRGRSRQTEGTRAGDDQHRDGDAHRSPGPVSGEQPEPEHGQ